MPTETSQKGGWCRYQPNLFCQERFCSNCEIYRKARIVSCPVCGADIGVWKEVFIGDLDNGEHICQV